MKNEKLYKDYNEGDFLCDEYFQDWIIHPDGEKNNFWENWLKENPSRAGVVAKAKELLSGISFIENMPSESQIESSLIKNLAAIEEQESSYKKPGIFRRMSIAWRVAAMFILIAGIGTLVYVMNTGTDTIQIATAYGKMDTLVLPDNSVVIMNANSRLKYDKEWKNKPRELWLEGEAYFDVKHLNKTAEIKPNERFIVHVKDADVEVLGTMFNIRERRGKIEVVLQQGKVKVSFKKNTQPDIIMKPGDIVTIDEASQKISTATTIPEDYTAWKNKKLVLTNASLNEIINYLEDNFGKKIVLSDPNLMNRKIEGTFKMDNLDDAMFVLSKVLNVDVVKEDSTLFLVPK